MKYAHIEKETGKLLGWYCTDIHTNIPENSIEVQDKVWNEALSINANYYEDGVFILKLHKVVVTETQILNSRQTAYTRRTDPLLNEARIKRLMGEEDQADNLEIKALEERFKIQAEYPYPETETN